jgi:hypothetical protein
MTTSHKARLGKLEQRAWIERPPAPIHDWELLQEGELEILEQASDIVDRAEAQYVQGGGTARKTKTKAYMKKLLAYVSDEDLLVMEQAAHVMERIQIHGGNAPLSTVPRTGS